MGLQIQMISQCPVHGELASPLPVWLKLPAVGSMHVKHFGMHLVRESHAKELLSKRGRAACIAFQRAAICTYESRML